MVTVTVVKSDAKAITAYTLDGERAVIDSGSGDVIVEFPSGKMYPTLLLILSQPVFR